ncbi:MAG: division plane positioning ATPase MipZ [Magnetospiraceae bacterium]
MASRSSVIVVGNEKGGTGKSTTAMHLIAGLLRRGLTVGCIDLDPRQATLSRFVENRQAFAQKNDPAMPLPVQIAVTHSDLADKKDAQAAEKAALEAALDRLRRSCAVVVLDCAGSADFLSRQAHAYADTLVTPLNDSFVDLDVLARVDPETHAIRHPSHYAELVWNERKRRAMRDGGSIDWIVLRNRLSNLDAHNKRRMEGAVNALAKRIGFRIAGGLGERVIYRELFLQGLTLMDLESAEDGGLSLSNVAARQEVRSLIAALKLPVLERQDKVA